MLQLLQLFSGKNESISSGEDVLHCFVLVAALVLYALQIRKMGAKSSVRVVFLWCLFALLRIFLSMRRLPLRPDFAANLPKIRREAAAMWPCYSGLRQKVVMASNGILE